MINENDNPYGVVEFTQDELSVSEDDGDLLIPLIRKGEIIKRFFCLHKSDWFFTHRTKNEVLYS